MEGAIPTARMRARAEVRSEILAEAHRQLAVGGASALSLRAVTRQLGMASSAAYRYFPSRDDLLTALIIEACDALGETAERTAAAATGSPRERWQTTCRAVRRWAVENPHDYALVYGSPVPGDRAPTLTIGPASRVTLVLAGLLADAQAAGALAPVTGPAPPPDMAAEAVRIGRAALPGVPTVTVARALVAWTQLFGQISFELFGQLEGVVGGVRLTRSRSWPTLWACRPERPAPPRSSLGGLDEARDQGRPPARVGLPKPAPSAPSRSQPLCNTTSRRVVPSPRSTNSRRRRWRRRGPRKMCQT